MIYFLLQAVKLFQLKSEFDPECVQHQLDLPPDECPLKPGKNCPNGLTVAIYLNEKDRRGGKRPWHDGTRHLVSMEGGFMTIQNETHICAELYQQKAACIALQAALPRGFMNLAFVWHAHDNEVRGFLNGVRVQLVLDAIRYSAGYTVRPGRLHLGQMESEDNALQLWTYHRLKLRDFAIWKRALDDTEIYKCLGISRTPRICLGGRVDLSIRACSLIEL